MVFRVQEAKLWGYCCERYAPPGADDVEVWIMLITFF